MAQFAQLTKLNEHCCPYCGAEMGEIKQDYDDEILFHCCACEQDYLVMFNSNSYDENEGYYTTIEDVTDHHRISLLQGDE